MSETMDLITSICMGITSLVALLVPPLQATDFILFITAGIASLGYLRLWAASGK